MRSRGGLPVDEPRAAEDPSQPVGASAAAPTDLLHNRRRLRVRDVLASPWAFMVPALLLVAAITFLPIVQAANLSVHETTYLEQGEFIGLRHFSAFLQDPLAWRNLANSAIFTAGSLLLALPLGVGLALALNRPLRGLVIFRTLLILPWVVSQLLAGLLWRWLESPLIGPVAYAVSGLANEQVDILGDTTTAMVGVIVPSVWRTFPFAMVLTLAALKTVPSELYEAAFVDGAGPWQTFWRITVPLIRNALLVIVILLTLHYFVTIELPLVLTGGGPAHATDVLGLRVYREAFRLNRFGFASAIAMVMFAINALISIAYIKILRTESRY